MKRRHFHDLLRRLKEPGHFLQVLVGPRQVGKTTVARQLTDRFRGQALYATSDDLGADGSAWLETQWLRARDIAAENSFCVMALDEIQRISHWSETVKRLYDEDRAHDTDVRALLLGSSAPLVQSGLGESLAGRFERSWMGHWSWPEMHETFGVELDDFVRFGGYPGPVPLQSEPQRWRAYVRDAIIEAAVSRDVLQVTRVDKPALLRAVFELSCTYSTRELSYQKMLGQLQDAGNTVTVAHYLELLHTAGLARGLQKYSGSTVRRRGSSPKLLALDPALVTATQRWEDLSRDTEPERWGQLVETAVGAHLNDARSRGEAELFYWREGGHEVDFVLASRSSAIGIEVKSGYRSKRHGGLERFRKRFPSARTLLVGPAGTPLGEFLSTPPERWLT